MQKCVKVFVTNLRFPYKLYPNSFPENYENVLFGCPEPIFGLRAEKTLKPRKDIIVSLLDIAFEVNRETPQHCSVSCNSHIISHDEGSEDVYAEAP
ncbi:unnamed protein product [Cylicostephanus goldi]|uniref:Uncharacterized protein n=1 Tax=Cylicostephanus goldi TaxID=71465 RepID=A0A3P6RM49_CYLGO|nr:unnamed protein product [Cylicostephanus goldi]